MPLTPSLHPKKFLFEYLKTRCLPDDVQKHIYEIEK